MILGSVELGAGSVVLRESPPPDAPDAAIVLLLFAHAGASILAYAPLAAALPAWVIPVGVELPGRGLLARQSLVDDLATLVDGILERIGWCGRLRVALFGHSIGALVAYALAQSWPSCWIRPQHLFVSAKASPFAQDPVLAGGSLGLIRQVRALGGTPAGVLSHPALMSWYEPVLRADLRLLCGSLPLDPLDVALTTLLGDRDPVVGSELTEDWGLLTTKTFSQRTFQGGHFYVLDDPCPVAAALTKELVISDAGGARRPHVEQGSRQVKEPPCRP